MAASKAPAGLSDGGRALWREITADHDLDAVQAAQLTEACRAKDRLDRLDEILRGDVDVWASITEGRDGEMELKVDAALAQANTTANLMKQLLAALRLPDVETGKKPQYRGARGAQRPSVAGGSSKVSSLDRARAAKSG